MIASINGGFDEADWTELAMMAEAAGSDALELNLKSLTGGMGHENVRYLTLWVRHLVDIFSALKIGLENSKTGHAKCRPDAVSKWLIYF